MKLMTLLSACVAGRHAAPTPTVGPEGHDFNAQLCDEVFRNSWLSFTCAFSFGKNNPFLSCVIHDSAAATVELDVCSILTISLWENWPNTLTWLTVTTWHMPDRLISKLPVNNGGRGTMKDVDGCAIAWVKREIRDMLTSGNPSVTWCPLCAYCWQNNNRMPSCPYTHTHTHAHALLSGHNYKCQTIHNNDLKSSA